MARRRREAVPESNDPAVPMEQPAEGAEPQIDVRMRGTADQVKRQLGVATEEKPEKKPEANGHDDEKKKFVEALRNPKYIIRVKRMTPREWGGQKTNVEVWQAELPLDYQEIQTEVTKGFGGEKYRVAVVDPQSNSTIAADVFTVDGDPIIPESDMTQEEMDRVLMRGQPKSAADLTEEGLDRRARVSAKMLEVEALEAQLEEARQRRTKPAEKASVQDDPRIGDIERRLVEAKHQAEIEARDRKHAEEMAELKALIAQNAKPAKSEGPSETMMLLQQMKESQQASDRRFDAMQKQMQDDKLNALLDEVKAIKNRPAKENGTMLEMAEAMLKMKKLFGWAGDDDDDDDDERDPNDTRPWYERALDKLGDKFIPRLIDKLDGMEEGGKKVTREDFLRELQAEATRQADAAVTLAQQRAGIQPNPALPAPSLPAAIPPPPNPPVPGAFQPPKPSSTSTPVTELPAPPPAPAPTAPIQQPAPPPGMSIEQEILIRVGGVLEMLSREIELRPNEYLWNYEGAFQSLPEPVLEKVCAAADPIVMVDAFAIPGIHPDRLSELKAKISGTPRVTAWVKMGHDELKAWWAEKLKDPKFDPFSDDEAGGEE